MKWIQFKIRFHDLYNQWINLFIIDTAFRDIINKHNPELWRIHRRYAKDPLGHQLSLLIYTDPQSPKISFNHKSIDLLEKHGLIKSVAIESFGLGFEKTSDAKWPEELQKSWPYFIHGTSQMLLDLIHQLQISDSSIRTENMKAAIKKGDLEKIKTRYKNVNFELRSMFTNEGHHAFMHHIAALFDSDKISMRT